MNLFQQNYEIQPKKQNKTKQNNYKILSFENVFMSDDFHDVKVIVTCWQHQNIIETADTKVQKHSQILQQGDKKQILFSINGFGIVNTTFF